MKKLLTLLLSMCMLLCLSIGLTACGDAGDGGDETQTPSGCQHQYSDGVCELCGEKKPSEGLRYDLCDDAYYGVSIGTCTDTKIVIPSTYDNKPVKVIDRSGFRDCTFITEVDIPNSIEEIRGEAFNGCTSLQKIEIPDSVRSIAELAFANCSGLKEVSLGNGVKTLGWYAFEGCLGVQSVDFGNSLEEIGREAFSGCSSSLWYEVTIPKSITSIGSGAFNGCKVIIRWEENPAITEIKQATFEGYAGTSIEIPEGVKSLGKNVFKDCPYLHTITFPNSLESIERQLFENCPSLQPAPKENATYIGNSTNPYLYLVGVDIWADTVTVDKNCKFIRTNAFYQHSALKTINLPEGLIGIGDYAFYDCGVKKIVIPSTVKKIGEYAIASCESLTEIEIRSTDLYLDNSAIYSCPDLSTIKISGTMNDWSILEKHKDWCRLSPGKKVVLVCSDGSVTLG